MLPASVFRPHGKFSIRVEGQILLTEVTGPWNRELVEFWAHQALQFAQQFRADHPYVAVTEVYDSILCPPDALQRIAQAVEYANQHLSCLGHCIIAGSNVDGRDIIRHQYEKIQLGQIFDNRDDAIRWARQQLG